MENSLLAFRFRIRSPAFYLFLLVLSFSYFYILTDTIDVNIMQHVTAPANDYFHVPLISRPQIWYTLHHIGLCLSFLTWYLVIAFPRLASRFYDCITKFLAFVMSYIIAYCNSRKRSIAADGHFSTSCSSWSLAPLTCVWASRYYGRISSLWTPVAISHSNGQMIIEFCP